MIPVLVVIENIRRKYFKTPLFFKAKKLKFFKFLNQLQGLWYFLGYVQVVVVY